MKLLIDTNVLVYDTIEDSEHHDDASKIIDVAEEIFIPLIVVHEYIWVMLKLSVDPEIISSKIHEYLEDVRAKYLHESINVLVEALKMLKEDRSNRKEINDYIILSLALNNKLAIATFDKKLKEIASKRGIETLP
jgi:Predicted nucleic acid-binding protein, contains PIN domain